MSLLIYRQECKMSEKALYQDQKLELALKVMSNILKHLISSATTVEKQGYNIIQ